MRSFFTLLAALACALLAGVFWAVSNFVMPALGRLPGAQGMAAMQSINRTVLNRPFLGVLFGTAVLCMALALDAMASPAGPGRVYRIAGCTVYWVGSIIITRVCHVPRNIALARQRVDAVATAESWSTYVKVTRLSELGLFSGPPALQQPRNGVVPYEVNAPLYAQDATKRRFVLVPPGERIHTTSDRWDIPEGTYLIKTFSFPLDLRAPERGERLIETRFLVRTDSGYIASTYVWNDAQTDAVVSSGNVDVRVSFLDLAGTRQTRVFHVPGTSDCASCHRGRALGFRSRQLDHAGQLARFQSLAVIDTLPPTHLVLTDPAGDAPLGLRARSYLDANCSHCHGDGGIAARTGLFWDLEHTSPSELPTCRSTRPVDGREHVLVRGHPEQSAFLARMRSADRALHMPRGATGSPDHAGIELLGAWVSAMKPEQCED